MKYSGNFFYMTLLVFFLIKESLIWVLLTPYTQNYLHLSKSIGIVHIVSIKFVTLFLVMGDTSAYMQI